MAYMKHYVIGVSIGIAAQPSAIAVIEQYARAGGFTTEVQELRLRHLDRLSLDTTYPALARKLRDIRDGLKSSDEGSPDLLVDITGTGTSVIRFFEKEDLQPLQVTITAGQGQAETAPRVWRISKTELTGVLQVELHNDKFRIAAGLPLADQFKTELANYRPKATAMNGNDLEAWREGQSDDLVFAVAIAAWQAQRHIPQSKRSMAEFDRQLNDPTRLAWVV